MIITDDTRRKIMVFVFIALVGCLLSIVFVGLHLANQTEQTKAECQQEIQDYINSVKLTSLGWDSSEDMLSAKLHGTAFLNQKIKECNNAD